MRFSIIVPVHNVERYIAECIESVLSQSYQDFELILVDDGSDDLSRKICDDYSSVDQRIIVIHQRCQGVSSARNAAINISCGEYIIFLDADDFWVSSEALSQINIRNEDADLVRFDFKIVTDGTNEKKALPIASTSKLKKEYPSGKAFLIDALTINPEFSWYSGMYAFRRTLWEEPESLRYPEGIRFHEDTAVIYKVILRAKKVSVITDCIYAYRKRLGAVSREDSPELLKNRLSVNLDQIKYIKSDETIDESLKTKLCKNMATAFYTDLIHVGAMNKAQQKEIISYLEKNASFFCNYPATKKQESVNKMLKLFGMKITYRILHIRRMIKYRHNF